MAHLLLVAMCLVFFCEVTHSQLSISRLSELVAAMVCPSGAGAALAASTSKYAGSHGFARCILYICCATVYKHPLFYHEFADQDGRLRKTCFLLVTRSAINGLVHQHQKQHKTARSASHPLPRRTFDVRSSHWLSPGHGHHRFRLPQHAQRAQHAQHAQHAQLAVPCLAKTAPATSVHLALRSPHSVHSKGSVRCSRGSVDARTSGHGGPVVTDLVALAHNCRIADKIDKLVVAESQAAISPETLSRFKIYQVISSHIKSETKQKKHSSTTCRF